MDVPEKANDGKGNRALFSGIAGDSMQQVVLCSDWCAFSILCDVPHPYICFLLFACVMLHRRKKERCFQQREGFFSSPVIIILIAILIQ